MRTCQSHRTIYGSQWMQALKAQETLTHNWRRTLNCNVKLECYVPLATANGSVVSEDLLEINSKEAIVKILDQCGTIALVELSSNPARPSHGVAS